MMIKGTLLVSLPTVENFQSENAYFLLSFSDPLEKPLDGFVRNIRTRPSQSGPTFCHIWRQTALGRFYGDSFNKKRRKTRNLQQPSVPAYAGLAAVTTNTVSIKQYLTFHHSRSRQRGSMRLNTYSASKSSQATLCCNRNQNIHYVVIIR